MKPLSCFALLAAFVSASFAQSETSGLPYVRIRIMHADPWAVKALLEGTAFNVPELSTILGFAGVPDKDSELVQSVFGGKGKIVVNSTDNSLLFIPEKKN